MTIPSLTTLSVFLFSKITPTKKTRSPSLNFSKLAKLTVGKFVSSSFTKARFFSKSLFRIWKAAALSSTKKLTATTVYAIKAQPKSSSVSAGLAAVTDWGGLWILPSVVASTNISITRQVGIWINYAGTNRAVTNVGVDIDATTATGGITTGNYGIRAGDVSGVATKARIMELGAAAAPYMLVKGSGEWTAAANETPVWIIENATLRQMKTIVETGLNIATGTKLIAYLV